MIRRSNQKSKVGYKKKLVFTRIIDVLAWLSADSEEAYVCDMVLVVQDSFDYRSLVYAWVW